MLCLKQIFWGLVSVFASSLGYLCTFCLHCCDKEPKSSSMLSTYRHKLLMTLIHRKAPVQTLIHRTDTP